MLTYNHGEQQNRTFDILVEGVKVGEQSIPRLSPQEQNSDFFDVEYKVPADLVKGRQKVTVRFQATNGNAIGTIYGIRMIRADAER
jgi:pantothenate kinase